MKDVFSRNEFLELRIKLSNAIERMNRFPIYKDSKEAGMLYAMKAMLIALENLDRE